MLTKVTTVLLIASVAFAAHVTFSENVGATIEDDLVKLEKVLNETIEDAGHKIIKVLIALNSTAIEVENKTASELNTLGEANQKDLDALKAKAKAANVNIDECLGQNETTLLNITNAFELANIKCVEGIETGVRKEAKGNFRAITLIRRVVSDNRKEVKDCAKDEQCLKDLEEKIETESSEIPKRVEGQVKGFSIHIELVQNGVLPNCGTGTVAGAEAESNALLHNITTCVNGKLEN